MTSAPARVRNSSALAVICCTLLVLLLPTVVVGLSVAEPATDGELARVERALSTDVEVAGVDSATARLFHKAAVPEASWPVGTDERQALVVSARLAQVLGMAALLLLTYLSVLLARGRLQALLACALFAVLPPVLQSGHVLRPETPATLFAMLSLVLMQTASLPTPRRHRRQPRRTLLMTSALMVCAAIAAALACEALPALGETLLVPGVILIVGAAQLGLRGIRCVRRRGMLGTPIRSLNRRLLPWTAVALLGPIFALLLLESTLLVPVDSLALTEPTSTLLPDHGVAMVACMIVMLVGLVSGVVRVGLRFGRGGRIAPDLVLLVFCAVFLAVAQTSDRVEDPLPLLPAMAVLLSEGARALLVLSLAAIRRRRA